MHRAAHCSAPGRFWCLLKSGSRKSPSFQPHVHWSQRRQQQGCQGHIKLLRRHMGRDGEVVFYGHCDNSLFRPTRLLAILSDSISCEPWYLLLAATIHTVIWLLYNSPNRKTNPGTCGFRAPIYTNRQQHPSCPALAPRLGRSRAWRRRRRSSYSGLHPPMLSSLRFPPNPIFKS